MTDDRQPPATFEQPTWKPPARRPVSHRITAVSTRPGAWRPPNPHHDDGDNAYLYIGDHRRASDRTGPNYGLRLILTALILMAIVGLIIAGVYVYTQSAWTS